jgi:HK97 gp10 family phage protein
MSDPKHIIDSIAKLPDKVQKKSATKATRKAMQIVRKAAVENAKAIDDKATGRAIWKNITVQNSPRQGKRVGGVVMRVGVRGGARKPDTKTGNRGGDTWYWRFLEFGTAKMRARPFLARALAANAQAVGDATAKELSAELDKEIKTQSGAAP